MIKDSCHGGPASVRPAQHPYAAARSVRGSIRLQPEQ